MEKPLLVEISLTYDQRIHVIKHELSLSLDNLEYLLSSDGISEKNKLMYTDEYNALQKVYFFYTGEKYVGNKHS